MTRECRDLIKKMYEILIDSNYTTTVDKFSYCFGHHYNFSVITDNQTTANMDPTGINPSLKACDTSCTRYNNQTVYIM